MELDDGDDFCLSAVSVAYKRVLELYDGLVWVVLGDVGGDVWLVGVFYISGLSLDWSDFLFFSFASSLASCTPR
jgi:hypothetical protein